MCLHWITPIRTVGLLALALVAPSLASATSFGDQDKPYPPWAWSGGANNPVQERGLEFTVPEIDDLPDFHGNPFNAKLSILVGGNYFFAMVPLVQEFERQHPEFKERIYYETIPPGLCYEQIKKHGVVTVGDMTWTVHADVYAAELNRINQAIDEGYAKRPAVRYTTNNLTIMVPKDNPAGITNLNDLAKPGVRLVMPNPAFEGIGLQIKRALGTAGGDDLVKAIYDTKVQNGENYMTRVHHRQSPLSLMRGRAQAGVTWQSEARFQEEVGNPISHVDIPDAQNVTAVYAAAPLKDAPHKKAAQLWVDFLHSDAALHIFERYGFKRYNPDH